MHIPFHQFPRRELNDASATSLNIRGLVKDVTSKDPFAFAHGLTGVDQVGNYLWVNVLLICFGVICVLTLGLRWAKMVHRHFRHLVLLGSVGKSSRENRQTYWTSDHTGWWPWIKEHLLYAPLWKKRHNTEIKISSAVSMGTLPSRFHMVILILYVGSNIAYCLALPWHRAEADSVVAALRGRSGSLSALNIIPTVLFALRNNPLIWILGVSYDTFNLLHRWAARLCILEALVHTLCWFGNAFNAGQWAGVESEIQDPSYAWGMVGTAFFLFIGIQAWAPLRHAFYETFLNLHRISVALAVAGVYAHIDLHMLPQLPWMHLVLFLWVCEWVFRAGRIIYRNFSLRFKSQITVQALEQEACRVTIKLARPWAPRPGYHVHLWMPTMGIGNWFTTHPFSVAWHDVRPVAAENEKLPSHKHDVMDLDYKEETTTSISMLIRACSGFTRNLYDKANNSPNRTFTTWGGVEGPYGGHDSLKSYGTVVLFAAGVGITHQLGFVKELLQGIQNGTVATKKIVLVWSVQKTEALEWVRPWMDEILPMHGRREHLKVFLFITRPNSPQQVQSPSGQIMMHPGRCNPQTVIDKEILERVGAIAVTCCGPGHFADDVRVAVKRRIDKGSIDFIEEAFSY